MANSNDGAAGDVRQRCRIGWARKTFEWGTNLIVAALALLTLGGSVGWLGWPIELLGHFRFQLAVLTALAGLACLVAGSRKGLALTCVLMLINASYVVMATWPSRQTPPADSTMCSLRVLYCNVWAGSDEHERVIDLVHQVDPDVVLFVELSPIWLESLEPMRDRYPHQVVLRGTFPYDSDGVGMFSRYPVINGQAAFLGGEGPPSVVADVRCNDRSISIVGTRLYPPKDRNLAAAHRRHARVLGDVVAGLEPPIALFGDLNATPWSLLFRDLLKRSGLRNTAVGQWPRPTWPADNPLLGLPIDHCLTSGNVVVRHRKVGPYVGSDHYPLIVDLAF